MYKCRQLLSRSYYVGSQLGKFTPKVVAGSLFWLDPPVRSFGNSGIQHNKFRDTNNFGAPKTPSPQHDNKGDYWERNQRRVSLKRMDNELSHRLVNFEKDELSNLLRFIAKLNSADFDSRSIEVAVRMVMYKIIELRREGGKGIQEIRKAKKIEAFFSIIEAKAHTFNHPLLLDCLGIFSFLGCPVRIPAVDRVLTLIESRLITLEPPQLLFLSNVIREYLSESKSGPGRLNNLRYTVSTVVQRKRISSNLSELLCSDLLNLLKTRVAGKGQWSQAATIDVLEVLLDKDATCNELITALDILAVSSGQIIQNQRIGQLVESLLINVLTKMRVDQMKIRELLIVIHSYALWNARTRTMHYNESFLKNAVQRILESSNLKVQCMTVLWFGIMGYLNVALMETCAQRIVSLSTSSMDESWLLYDTFLGFARLNYMPDNWESLKPLFLECALQKQPFWTGELTTAICFLSLGILPHELLSDIFANLSSIENLGPEEHPKIVTIYNALKLFPEYNGPIPSHKEVKLFSEIVRNRSNHIYPLKSTLEIGLGGEVHLLSGVFHNGIHVDHCIIMGRRGCSKLLDNVPPNLSSLDEILRPDNRKMILIKVLRPEAYLSNFDRLTGAAALEKKILSTFGRCICINIAEWEKLESDQKVPYLMQRIRGHCQV